MSTFAEYAALARHLAEQRRAGERDAAAEAGRRRDLHAAADSLQHRLTVQGQRLDQLGRALGVAPSALPGGAPPPPPSAPVSGGPVAPFTGPGPVRGAAGGAAVAPVRAEVGAYPPGVGLALPTAAVPGPRTAEVDAAGELELARRHADEADRHGQQADALAQLPTLLPTWSPMARAVAVYSGCAAVGVALMLFLVVASGVGVVDLGTLYAWMCAGLPAVSLIGGWLILGRWGKPPLVVGVPPRFVHLGILICFGLLPLAYCGYLLVFRALR